MKRVAAITCALALALVLAPAAQAEAGEGSECPPFRVLHNDRVGKLELPAGYYTLVPFNPSLLSCQKAAKLFAEFLQDFDGKLPRNWRVLPRRKAFQRGQSEVGFYVRPTGSGGGGGAGGGKHPADGRACQGLFRVLHNDKIGSLNLPAGQYKITRLAKRPTCKRASKLFAKFLAHSEGILPNGWKLNARTATFKKGKDAAFRVKRVSS